MNKFVKAPEVPEEPIPVYEEEKKIREIDIPQARTKAAAAEVRFVDGEWKAVRLDGKPRLDDKFLPPTHV